MCDIVPLVCQLVVAEHGHVQGSQGSLSPVDPRQLGPGDTQTTPDASLSCSDPYMLPMTLHGVLQPWCTAPCLAAEAQATCPIPPPNGILSLTHTVVAAKSAQGKRRANLEPASLLSPTPSPGQYAAPIPVPSHEASASLSAHYGQHALRPNIFFSNLNLRIHSK